MIDDEARREAPVAAPFDLPIVGRPIRAGGDPPEARQQRCTGISDYEVAVGNGGVAPGIGPELQIGSARAQEQEIQISGRCVRQTTEGDEYVRDPAPLAQVV